MRQKGALVEDILTESWDGRGVSRKGVAGEVERRRPVGGGGAVENVLFLRPGPTG